MTEILCELSSISEPFFQLFLIKSSQGHFSWMYEVISPQVRTSGVLGE